MACFRLLHDDDDDIFCKKEKDQKLRDVTSHVYAETTHVELPPPKLSYGVGSRT